jgi:hypothetical protein
MTVSGRVRNGVIVVDEPNVLPEGAAVQILLLPADSMVALPPSSLFDRLAPVVGAIEDVPEDASVNLDHYLYGHLKK